MYNFYSNNIGFNSNSNLKPVPPIQPVPPTESLDIVGIGCIGKWALVKFAGTSMDPPKVWPVIIESSDPFGMTVARVPPSMNKFTFPSSSMLDTICLP